MIMAQKDLRSPGEELIYTKYQLNQIQHGIHSDAKCLTQEWLVSMAIERKQLPVVKVGYSSIYQFKSSTMNSLWYLVGK